jgi:trigger factor
VPVKTKIIELPASRVRVDAEVSAEELESTVQRTASALGREMRIPGFRKGKVPAPMVIRRMGREFVLEQAVKDALPHWYEEALMRADVSAVGDPKLDLGELPPAGESLSFSIEVGITPKAELGRYEGLEVGRAEPEVPEEAVEAELERLREGFGRVETVDRPIAEGDLAVLDFVGRVDGEEFEGGRARDYMLEVGSGRLIEGFEEQLVGARAGESRTVELEFPADYHAEELAGKPAAFDVEVKEVKEKALPALDDDFASEASEFDTLEDLRADIRHKLAHAQEHSIEHEFREAVVDAAVAEADVQLPDELVQARAEEMWSRTERALARQNIDPETYLKASGKTREALIEEALPDAARALGRESVLEAVVEAESIGVSDEDLAEVLEATAEREKLEVDELLRRLKETGRDVPLRRDLALRKAADVLVESAVAIPMEKAAARDKLWTPEKEPGGSGQLWTPGDPAGAKPQPQ